MSTPILTNDQIAGMRQALKQLLPSKATITRITRTADGAGGWTETETTIASGVICRIDAVQLTDQEIAAGVQPFSRWWVSFPVGTNVLYNDKLTIGDYEYNVTGEDTGKSWELVMRILAERVSND